MSSITSRESVHAREHNFNQKPGAPLLLKPNGVPVFEEQMTIKKQPAEYKLSKKQMVQPEQQDLNPTQRQVLMEVKQAAADQGLHDQNDQLLLRFCNSRQFDLEKSKEMMSNYIDFKNQNGPNQDFFQNYMMDGETGEWIRTEKKAKVPQDNNPHERTIKAHSFKIATKTENKTQIALMAADDHAHDASIPVKVLYVKPQIKRAPSAHPQPNTPGMMIVGGPKKFARNNSEADSGFHALANVSGIFKKKKPESEKDKLIAKQKSYAAQVRELAKTMPKKPQQQVVVMTPKEDIQMFAKEAQQRMPHSQNRFKDKSFNHTDLFKKAYEKIQKDKHIKQISDQAQQIKKQRDKEYLNELNERNKQLVRPRSHQPNEIKLAWRPSGKEDPETSQNQTEEQYYAEQARKLKDQKRQNGRPDMGLEQADRRKLQKLQQEKYEEKIKMKYDLAIQAQEARQKREEDKIKKSTEKIQKELKEDDQAQPVVDRKAILREQRLKRKQQEEEKHQAELAKEFKKKAALDAIERHRQEDALAEKKRRQEQEDKKRMKSMRKNIDDQQQKVQKPKAEQLIELRDFIDDLVEQPYEEKDKRSKSRDTQSAQLTSLPSHAKSQSTIQSKMQPVPMVTKHSLPGNSLIPVELEKATQARKNRYGLESDNGFDLIAERQLAKEGYPQTLSQPEMNILDFQKDLAPSPPKEITLKMSRPEGPRKIVNAAVPDKAFSQASLEAPGTLHIQTEAMRQKMEQEKREALAATQIQRRVRGINDRKRAKRLRQSRRFEIEADHQYYMEKYKKWDRYNIDRYIKEKQKMRALNGTQDLDQDDSISEKIEQSQSQIQVAPAMQQMFYGVHAQEKDPYSLISLYAKRHAPQVPAEKKQLEPKDHNRDLRKVVKDRRQSRRSTSAKRKQKDEDSIEEDIPAASGSYTKEVVEQEEEIYTSVSEKIDESIPSATKLSNSKRFSGHSKEESIIEESMPGSGYLKKTDSHEETIEEEDHLQKSAAKTEESIEDEIPEAVADSSVQDDQISEESHLKSSKKVSFAKENMRSDFERDGKPDLAGPLRQQRQNEIIGREEAKLAENQKKQYQMSRQIIDDFEQDKTKHEGLMKGLVEEIKRYEAAVSGQIFVEQFQNIVNKSLAKKDMMMLGQRLSQLEQENKHKQEIADIRAEQIRMMSQLMLLTAGQGLPQGQGPAGSANKELLKKQEELMKQIQGAIQLPIPIVQQVSPEPKAAAVRIEEIKEDIGQSVESRKTAGVLKLSSIGDSVAIKGSMHIRDEESEIIDEVGSPSQIEDSIKESIIGESGRDSEKTRSDVRKMMASEQAVIEQSREALGQKKTQKSPFEKNSFKDFQQKQFKEAMLSEKNNDMLNYLNQVEHAMIQKKEKEQDHLKKQVDQRKISPRTYKSKKQELEKWVSQERATIVHKRKQVHDSITEIKNYVGALDKDRKLTMEMVQGTPRDIRQAEEQMEQLKNRDLIVPETKYIEKKRDFVNDLMAQKNEAIEKGVKEELSKYEGAMLDDMMQHALNLDVDQEIQRRVQLARQMVEHSQVEESQTISKSGNLSQSRKSKKNVTFKQQSEVHYPEPYSSASSKKSRTQGESSISRSMQKKESVMEDSIGESIIDGSIQESMPSHSASKLSQSKRSNKSKRSQMKSVQEKQAEESDSLDRDEAFNENLRKEVENSIDPTPKKEPSVEYEEDESDYDDDFIEESIASGTSSSKKSNLRSKSVLESKIEESGGYSDDGFIDISKSQVQSLKGSKRQIPVDDPVKEESVQQSSKSESAPPPESADPSDREILESTQSVIWKVDLPEWQQDEEQSEVQEEFSYEQQSPKSSERSLDDEARADQITDEIMQMVFNDLQNANIKLHVEDEIDEDEYENKWPFNIEKKEAEREKKRQEERKREQIEEMKRKEEEEKSKEAQIKNIENEQKAFYDDMVEKADAQKSEIENQRRSNEEYLRFVVQIVDREVLTQALSRPIEHDPLKMLEQIQALDTEDATHEFTQLTTSQHQQVLSPYLFDEIERCYEEAKENSVASNRDEERKLSAHDVSQIKSDSRIEKGHARNESADMTNLSQEARNIHHLAIFDAFNEALDNERPYKHKGMPTPWSKQTRITNEILSAQQVDEIIEKAIEKVLMWDKMGAGTRYAPPPPPPPIAQDGEPPMQYHVEPEEERNKFERQERLGYLLTKEVHLKEQEWLDYEVEDTQVRFDLADMILEELADEVTQFLIDKSDPILAMELRQQQKEAELNNEFNDYGQNDDYYNEN